MRQSINKISAVLMAFIVMLSTLSFAVDMHYCGDSLVDTSILNNAQSCGMEAPDSETSDCEIMKPNCCTDTQFVFEGQDDLQLSYEDIDFDNQIFIASYILTYINLFEGLEDQIVPFKYYSPPRVVKDIQELDQVYLI
ncbi:MAG: hypothetical protein HKO96_03920 [Flavobacteriaceae bacterium]|nr:hypothetical protein [Flavobacteriaceae bacterium]NNL79881.1 hypothetical protein [Flavobacteriaceae bacterium]